MRGARHALLTIASLCAAALPALAADPYAEYRIPDHRWLSWSARLTAEGYRTLNHSSYSEEVDRQGYGRVFTSLYGGFDSDRNSRAYGLALSAIGELQTSDQSALYYGDTYEAHQRNEYTNEYASAFYALSRFPWQAPLGFSLSTNAAIFPGQRWSSLNQSRTSPPGAFYPGFKDQRLASSTHGSYDANASLLASVDWGRVRDATPVYQVQVLEQRLHETGAIQGELSRGARERLAALYTVEGDVSFAHQRPTKYFWRELERLLTDDGVLGPGGLDAYTVQRLLEPITLEAKAFARTRGYSFGPLVILGKDWRHESYKSEYQELRFLADTLYYSYADSIPRTKVDNHDESINTGLFVEYHRPFGMRWQADAFSRALVSDGAKEVVLHSSLDAAWAIADRWQWNGSLSHDATAPGQGGARKVDHWTLGAATSLAYFFEDSWAFQIGYQHQQDHASTTFRRNDTYTLGVTYQFAGWLTAPGLFAPMRLTPPGD